MRLLTPRVSHIGLYKEYVLRLNEIRIHFNILERKIVPQIGWHLRRIALVTVLKIARKEEMTVPE